MTVKQATTPDANMGGIQASSELFCQHRMPSLLRQGPEGSCSLTLHSAVAAQAAAAHRIAGRRGLWWRAKATHA